MTEFFRAAFRAFLFVFLISEITGCQSDEKKQALPSNKKYSIYAMMKNGEEYLVQTDSIAYGVVNPETVGAKVVPAPLYYDLIVDNGYYYHQSWRNGKFIKSAVLDHVFKQVDSCRWFYTH